MMEGTVQFSESIRVINELGGLLSEKTQGCLLTYVLPSGWHGHRVWTRDGHDRLAWEPCVGWVLCVGRGQP